MRRKNNCEAGAKQVGSERCGVCARNHWDYFYNRS